MELHSYAKRKASKKWTAQQKRRLVETRISCDSFFKNQRNSMLPWKKVLSLANLEDFSIFFVRKQWSSMVAKYKQYKQNRLGNIPNQSIDNDTIRKISDEWEFFYPIHRFMTGKTTNLHSYAQKLQDTDDHNEPTGQNNVDDRHEIITDSMNSKSNLQPLVDQIQNSASSTEQLNVSSSDTNEDFTSSAIVMQQQHHQQNTSLATAMNTDHDFYTKPTFNRECNYFADVSEDTHESMIVELTTTQTASNEVFMNTASSSRTSAKPNQMNRKGNSLASLSERDKYYRHKRRFNRRLEKRFDSLLNVFGQIVKAEYPSIDVSPILSTAAASANLVNNLFSSSGDEDDDDEDNKTVNSKQNENVDTNGGEVLDNREAVSYQEPETIEEIPLFQ